MKITRTQLVNIIKQSIILESRKMKQQFYDQVRSKYSVPSRQVMDLSLPEPFVTHQPNFGYSGSEFTVVPKKVAAVVYLPDHDRFPDRAQEELGKSFQSFRIPHVVGKNQVSELYRSLYTG